MRASFLAGSAVTLVMALALAATPPARAQAAAPSPPAAEVERIVREFLLREPEVVYLALQELQKRQELAQTELQKRALAENRDAIFAAAADPVGGNPQGDVTVVEFFDYRCGYCRTMAPTLRAFLDQDPKIRFVFKDMPILSAESMLASRAALASARQGKYAEFHFALMQSRELGADAVLALATKVGLDAGRLAADMDDPAIAEHLEGNLRLAQALGIDGTPAFVVGDQIVPGAVEVSRLAELVAKERQGSKGN